MTKVILGNHTAVIAARSEQDRIRKFYGDVLGCNARVKSDEVDRFQLDDVHFCFVYQDTAFDEGAFQKSTWLELKADDTEEMKRRILAFGVKKLDVPDAHLYFQAPGGQVFRLVGIDEDLSVYEGSPSSKPGSSV
jgi:catechol 2,3-dioxygenase-like lactoylglutathione lyase family enzyme